MNGFRLVFVIAFLIYGWLANAQDPKQWTSAEIQHAIKKLKVLGSALYLAAHPDDENTRMITWLANDKMVHTAYLSLTRGDGGQNLIGPEIRELLGVIRTQELLKAREVDGGHQFFSRANDFGFSKNAEETLTIWDKEKVLADVVWTIRKMQPDIIINRFPHVPAPTHGHHTASAQLSYEAFDAAADPKRFPEQLKYVKIWQPTRLVFNTSYWFYGSQEAFEAADKSDMLGVDVGTYYPLLGKSNNEIAGESRSQHQCQGMGTAQERGSKMEYFEHLKGSEAKNDLFEGIPTSWARLKGGKKIQNLVETIDNQFEFENPAASISALLELRKAMNTLEESVWKTRKLAEVEALIEQCLGLYLEVVAEDFSTTAEEPIKLKVEALNRSSISIKLKEIQLMNHMLKSTGPFVPAVELKQNQPYVEELEGYYSEMPYARPYWLESAGTVGMYEVAEQELIGLPENPEELEAVFLLEIAGEHFEYRKPIVFKEIDPVKGEVYRPFEISPDLFVNLSDKVLVFANDKAKWLDFKVKSGVDGMKGNFEVRLPKGWETVPSSLPIDLKKKGDEQALSFEIFPPKNASSAELSFSFEGKLVQEEFELDYDHIPTQLLFLDAKVNVVRLDIQPAKRKIAYYMGAGDVMPASLRQMGFEVSLLGEKDMNAAHLASFDVIIMGIRAFNTQPRLRHHQDLLMNFVKTGGTMIVQYNTSHRLITEDLAPYPLKLSRDRVTDETAEVTILQKDHPVLNFPNKISSADFEGWVQERGLYFPNEWDSNFQALLSMHDRGETPKKGSLLVADYGEGHYIYTGISWFRQLPAGVPGAYRLFANLVAY